MVQLDAVVNLCPQPAQYPVDDADGRIRYVRRDLHRVFTRVAARLLLGRRIVARLVAYRSPDTWRHHDLIHERPPVGQIRPDRSRPPLAKMHAQNSRHLAVRHRGIDILGDDRAQRQCLAEAKQRVSAEKDRREELARAARHVPVLGEHELEERTFLLRRPAPVDRNGYQQEFMIVTVCRLDESPQPRRTRGRRTPEDQSFHAAQHDDTARLALAAAAKRLAR